MVLILLKLVLVLVVSVLLVSRLALGTLNLVQLLNVPTQLTVWAVILLLTADALVLVMLLKHLLLVPTL